MTTRRDILRSSSNNEANPNKNLCGLAIAAALNVSDNVRYIQVISDLKRAISTEYALQSVKSYVTSKGHTKVGNIRTACAAYTKQDDAPFQHIQGYLVWVQDHVLFLSPEGITAIDTDPRIRDGRKVLGIWAVRRKCTGAFEIEWN
tara:strand:- start:2525 stop:2962 length:438 start_codon:yes stop_codon:yes gene_type:complete